jgi:hypothetical protein|nr:MAG TPA: hypothetical protein [Caudoviricetes sp.]
MANFKRVGFGQVEPNQLSAQKTGQIYASLPLDSTVQTLQNGEFMYYSYADGKVTAEPTVAGQEPMLVFNEVKMYEPQYQTSYKNFAMIRVGDNYVTSDLSLARCSEEMQGIAATVDHVDNYRMDGIAPRLFKTNVGDVFTTNMVKTGVEYQVGNILKLSVITNNYTDSQGVAKTYKTLVLDKNGTIDTIQFVVAKVYTMPDGQPGLKLQRIK